MMEKPVERRPLVSVVVPTFKRPALLKRAVDSVYRQTLEDWELIITDDEAEENETWQFAGQLAARDPRVRAVRNDGTHGQSGNVNNGLRLAAGQWIKLLYDDDLLHPRCLETMLDAVGDDTSIAMATCLVDRYRDGRLAKAGARGRRARVERISRSGIQLAMYLQDVDIGMPTQVLVNRSCIEQGVLFEEPPGIQAAVDSWWFTRILQHGDLVMVNKVLAEEHQGNHASITRSSSEDTLDREMELLRKMTLPMIDPACRPPPLHIVKQSLRLIRAMHRLLQRNYADAVRLAISAWHPQAWWLTGRWLLRRSFPGRFEVVARTVLDP